MWFIPLLLALALPVEGELKVRLEQSVYPTDDSTTMLEISYEIPNTSLTFLRQESAFVARYQVSVQVSDKRRDIVAGDIWQSAARFKEYGPTVDQESVEAGAVSLTIPKSAIDARVGVNDLESERSALATFRIERPTGGLIVRFFRAGKPASVRKYGIGDTLVAVAEAVNSQSRFDSCRFVVKHEGRAVTGATLPARTGDEGGRTKVSARFEFPIGDSTSVARLGGGDYTLEVASLGAGQPLSATTGFRVDVPFYLDDSVYVDKVNQLVYVATDAESKHLRSVPRGERRQAWSDFWKKRGPSPTSKLGLTEEDYFERIQYAQEHFVHGDRGYLSDRGHVYVLYGPPDQIDSRPFEIDSPAQEVWYYYQASKQFEFVDKYGAGEFVLVNREEL
ncbi:MAG TPA: GWxTD domain-containing protein [bacterium]|nr:GWxTD domain-containing protein [bacterium]